MYGIRRATHWRFGSCGIAASAFVLAKTSNQRRSTCTAHQAKQLHHVVVIHRHGDRAPVTRSIGPKYPHSLEIQNLWQEKLLSGHNLELMKLIAKSQSNDNNDDVYTGRDIASIPYGQLTDKGSSQLIDLGRTLRDVYVDQHKFLPAHLNGDMIYARSSSMCRTINSLRSLLVGLYGFASPEDITRRVMNDVELNTTSSTFPTIRSYPTGTDPLIDGPCDDPELKNEMRRKVLEMHNIPHGYPHGYQALEEKMRECLGFEIDQRVNWLAIREQLVCMHSHDLAFPEGLDASVMDQLYGLELWICKHLFGNPSYNALAIGAFYRELRDRLLLIETGAVTEQLSIYSAHDYTLIPFMEGLGILPSSFPHYAAYIVMEVATVPAAAASSSITVAATNSDHLNDIITTKTSESTPMFIRFLYNGNEVIFPGQDQAWMTLEDVNNKLLLCATPTPLSTSTSTEKEETAANTTIPLPSPPPSTRSKL